MWGTRKNLECGNSPVRFIPTHVGNTSIQVSRNSTYAVHPHACGEHRGCAFVLMTEIGSSPRMWGTPRRRLLWLLPPRFIPTHVGNTLFGFPLRFLLSVHPHACGEHQDHPGKARGALGSSPRMWGTPERFRGEGRGRRFIPTHVGNTPWQPVETGILAVHPHACGEHGGFPTSSGDGPGSSPRMWGTLVCGLAENQ